MDSTHIRACFRSALIINLRLTVLLYSKTPASLPSAPLLEASSWSPSPLREEQQGDKEQGRHEKHGPGEHSQERLLLLGLYVLLLGHVRPKPGSKHLVHVLVVAGPILPLLRGPKERLRCAPLNVGIRGSELDERFIERVGLALAAEPLQARCLLQRRLPPVVRVLLASLDDLVEVHESRVNTPLQETKQGTKDEKTRPCRNARELSRYFLAVD